MVELVANKIASYFDFSSNINYTSGDIHLPITYQKEPWEREIAKFLEDLGLAIYNQ